MKMLNEEIRKSLIQLCEINDVRVKGYQKAIEMIKIGSLKRYFQIKINETINLTDCINRSIIGAGFEKIELDNVGQKQIHQSQFYFTMAFASTNPRTVALSCQLGDKFAEKAYASVLSVIQLLSFPDLLNVLSKHVSSLRKSFETTQKAFDSAFIY